MEALLEKLDEKLHSWPSKTSQEVRERLSELIEAADEDRLDISRSRLAEQEVLDLLDES